MLRGLATVSFWATDVTSAITWYAELLGIEPYFVRPEDGPPMYAEFRLGDHQDELGIIDRRFGPPSSDSGPGGAVIYWHVDDVQAAIDRCTERGAVAHEPLTPREAGFATASVVDPFGNILGLMTNPHWLEIAEGSGS